MKKYHMILPAAVSICAVSLAVGGVSAGLQAGSYLVQAAERGPATPAEAEEETDGEEATSEAGFESGDEAASDTESESGVEVSSAAGEEASSDAESESGAESSSASESPATPAPEPESESSLAASEPSHAYPAGSPSGAEKRPAFLQSMVPQPEQISLLEQQKAEYSLCGYSFQPYDGVLELALGEENDLSSILTEEIELYVDGPEGHIDDPVYMSVEWDLSDVDFSREGEYTVAGALDTDACPYPLNWDGTESPSFTIKIIKPWTLSFEPILVGDTLTLNYKKENSYISLSNYLGDLYESQDGGASWSYISESLRVCHTEQNLSITGVKPGSMYQIIWLDISRFCSDSSDIVAVSSGETAPTASVIASGGVQGGGVWGPDQGSFWDEEPVFDGPYPILGYKTGSWYPMELDLQVTKGNDEALNRDFYNQINVYFGNSPEGAWYNRYKLDVQWDWAEADAIDWNQVGDTVIHGRFPDYVIEEMKDKLDFDHMPELSFTISVREPKESFTLSPAEEKLYANQTAIIQFYDETNGAFAFAGTSGLTVWCSVDGQDTWYNITDEPNVTLTNDSVSVSYLSDKYLRGKGYFIQIEQTLRDDLMQYSASQTITHSTGGIYFGTDIGGERGGGKRQEKPPEGLFSLPESGAPDETLPDETPDKPEEPNGSDESGGSEEPGRPDGPENPDGSDESDPQKPDFPSRPDHSGAGNDGDDENDSNGGNSLAPAPEKSAPDPVNESPESVMPPRLIADASSRPDSTSTTAAPVAMPSGQSHLSDANNSNRDPKESSAEAPAPSPGSSELTGTGTPGLDSAKSDRSADAAASGVVSSAQKTSNIHLIRVIAGIFAIAAGGMIGYWMIRRR